MKPRLLQLGQVNIARPSTGAQLRNYYLLRELSKVMEVTHLGFHDAHEALPSARSNEQIRMTIVPKGRTYTIGKLVHGALGKTPVTLLNFQNAEMAAALRAKLSTTHYDIVQLEGIEVSPYLRIIQASRHRPKYIVLDWHNVESEVVMRHSQYAASPLRRLYMRRAARQLEKIECTLLDCCDLHLVVSERDGESLTDRQPEANVSVVENGVDVDYFRESFESGDGADEWAKRDRLLFCGSMDYSANVDAMMYFVSEIWPLIRRQLPDIVLTIAGRNPPEKVKALAADPGIEVTGTLPDVRPYYGTAFASIVPIRVAGGTRLKILEAMAAGVPVVSTTIGAEGLRAMPAIHLCLADTPADFVRQVTRLRNDLQWSRQLSGAAHKLVASIYDWRVIGVRLVDTYFNLLNQAGATGQTRGRSLETRPRALAGV